MNALAEAYKETLNLSHVYTKTNRLSKNDQLIAILEAAQSLLREGYPVLAETLLSLVKRMLS